VEGQGHRPRTGYKPSFTCTSSLLFIFILEEGLVGVKKIAPSSKKVPNFADFLPWFKMPAFHVSDVFLSPGNTSLAC
jgi:hypothetical protein